MSLRLILMRHAKSSWSDPRQVDHERPLNPRGERSAALLGDWLRQRACVPNQAMVSSALRTRQTFDGLALPLAPEVDDKLYHAGPVRLLTALRAARGQCVLLVAHNPGIVSCAAELLAAPPEHPRFRDFPTGATLVADFAIDTWSELRPGLGETVDFITPRDLET